MSKDKAEGWVPFRPEPQDLEAIARDVAEVGAIQQRLVERHPELKVCDRVAHQYQIAGGRVLLQLEDTLPAPLAGVGLFQPGAQFTGIGRVSTGLGTPHLETNPDFLGLMLAFQTAAGRRVDFLAINDPAAPTDNHREFVDVLHATAEAAGAEMPLVGDWGAYDVFNLVAEQKEMVGALKARMGWKKAGMTAFHLTRQTIRTFFSSSAVQSYWTGIHEVGGTAGKFSLVPGREVNGRPEFRPGEGHLSEDWRRRQSEGDLDLSERGGDAERRTDRRVARGPQGGDWPGRLPATGSAQPGGPPLGATGDRNGRQSGPLGSRRGGLHRRARHGLHGRAQGGLRPQPEGARRPGARSLCLGLRVGPYR